MPTRSDRICFVAIELIPLVQVLFVAKRSKAFDHPPMLFASPKSASGNAKQQFDWLGTAGAEAADIDESSWQDALRRIKVRYLDTYADLRSVCICGSLHHVLPRHGIAFAFASSCVCFLLSVLLVESPPSLFFFLLALFFIFFFRVAD